MNVFRQVFTADDPRGPWPARDVVKVLEHLREWSQSHQEWAELCRVQYDAQDLPPGPERDAARMRMAELNEAYADRMERSGLVRAMTSGLITPESLRAEAAVWRAGGNPYDE